ncbi:SHOCT domain-containing protein [Cellulomonas sp. URHB0016]
MDSFWSWFWLLIWWFVFLAYLVILFQILTDLFRDHALSGWWKAVWVVLLVVLPFVTALVYMIARGTGMADRQLATVQRAKADTDTYIRSAAGITPAQHIGEAKALLDAGVIDKTEFDQLKAKALT